METTNAIPGLLKPAPLLVLIVAGPVLWLTRLVVAYVIVAVACVEGLVGPVWIGMPVLGYVVLAVSGLLAAGCLGTALLSWRALAQSRTWSMGGRGPVMAAIALFLNLFFLATILAETIATFFLHPCA